MLEAALERDTVEELRERLSQAEERGYARSYEASMKNLPQPSGLRGILSRLLGR